MRLLKKLEGIIENLNNAAVIFSNNGESIFRYELGDSAFNSIPFKKYDNNNFYAPFASGSANFDTLIVAPCSMGTLARIANGLANDLISRTADVMLKERRRLILITRESPLSIIHLRNMEQVTLSGGIICTASPSFYNHPLTIEQAVDTVVDRALSLAGFEFETFHWGENTEADDTI
jgi:4-hydroxy-3-polyprenylbenzoate decarboxylase